MLEEKIAVVDFGGQYTQLIAKSVRKCNVFSEIIPNDYSVSELEKQVNEGKLKGIILSGGPASAYDKGAPSIDRRIFDLDVPVLGLCYGMQLENHLLGGSLLHGNNVVKEYGETGISVDNDHGLFRGLEDGITGWMSHGDSVDRENLAPGFGPIAWTKHHVAGMADDSRRIYGLQFHPEVTHTPMGSLIMSNFVDICGCSRDWTPANFIEESKKYVMDTVGDSHVIVFASGGVDSSYVAKLISDTLEPEKVHCIYIEGLMRRNETEEVVESLTNAGIYLRVVRAEQRFIDAVKDCSDPEMKRKRVADLFIDIQNEVIREIGLDPDDTYLAMGSLYTDLIESGKGIGNKADTIKTHHNIGGRKGLVEQLRKKGMIVEPNRLIFKDEVRKAAEEIGLPENIYSRQPYPGPGYAIRVVDAWRPWHWHIYGRHKFRSLSRKVNRLVEDIARESGAGGSIEGYLLPVKTVGVQGDGRTYSFSALLRGEKDWSLIREATKRIPKELHDVNRVFYEVDPHNIEQKYTEGRKKTRVNDETSWLFKEVDSTAREIISSYGFEKDISQTIVPVIGADIYNNGKRAAVLRAVHTDDFMTVSPIEPLHIPYHEIERGRGRHPVRMTWECLENIALALKCRYSDHIGSFLIDVTDKPPATTCLE